MLKYLFALGLLSMSGTLFGQTELTVSIEGGKEKNQGTIIIMLFASENGFPGDPNLATLLGKIDSYSTAKAPTYTFENLPPGEYAITLFIDENGNGEMDRNFLGIPKEPLGAANQKGLGKPSYKRSLIKVLPNEVAKVSVKLLNN